MFAISLFKSSSNHSKWVIDSDFNVIYLNPQLENSTLFYFYAGKNLKTAKGYVGFRDHYVSEQSTSDKQETI